MVAGEQLERDQRRAAAGGTLVLEPAAQELELLPVAELPDPAVGRSARAVVAVAGRRLDLVVPLLAELCELALGAGGGQLVRLRRSLREIQRRTPTGNERRSGPTYSAEGRMMRLSRCCSSTCAAQPATRLAAKSG